VSFLGSKSAVMLPLAPRLSFVANFRITTRRNRGDPPPSYIAPACSIWAAVTFELRSLRADDDLVLSGVPRVVSRLLLGHGFGATSSAPSALGLLLRLAHPFGVSMRPQTSFENTAKNAVQTSFGPLPESRPSTLGSRAHSLSFAQV
jgi:hypothetical protein